MTDRPRRRYRVRLRTALAGSMFAAAAAATSLTGFAAAPALAAPPRSVSASSTLTDDDAFTGLAAAPLLADVDLTDVDLADVDPADRPAGAPASAERLADVRADLDRAVSLRLVTPDQAEAFYRQIERRVAAGL